MANHIETECPRRKVDCQYCKLSEEHQFIEGKHKEQCTKLPIHCPNECDTSSIPREDMTAHRLECPLEIIECKYFRMGCRNTMARKDWYKHEKEKMEEHLHLTSNRLTECQAKISELESEMKLNRALTKLLFGEWAMQLNIRALQLSTGNQVLPVIVRMPEYSKMKDWYSDPFYTQEKGYKIQLKVVFDYYRGSFNYLSIYLCLMKGPYDDELPWPLKGMFQVKALNQINDNSHHAVTRSVDNVNMLISNDIASKEVCCSRAPICQEVVSNSNPVAKASQKEAHLVVTDNVDVSISNDSTRKDVCYSRAPCQDSGVVWNSVTKASQKETHLVVTDNVDVSISNDSTRKDVCYSRAPCQDSKVVWNPVTKASQKETHLVVTDSVDISISNDSTRKDVCCSNTPCQDSGVVWNPVTKASQEQTYCSQVVISQKEACCAEYQLDTCHNDSTTKEVWHSPQFIKIIPTLQSHYLKNDSLIFEVSKCNSWWDLVS